MMNRQRTALVCGIGGQDGSLLARLLLAKGYRVFGTSRDADGKHFTNLTRLGISENVQIISMNSIDFRSVLLCVERANPDEVFFLSGQSSVGLSFSEPAETMQSIVSGTLNMLEACRLVNPSIRQYYAGSVDCFGDTGGLVVSETSAFRPRSPYGVAKSSASWLVNNYREAYGLFAVTGILSNHESALRPERFVTQKIIEGVKDIVAGRKEALQLGRLDIRRDWGWASEFVEAMLLMLQHDTPEDFLIATGHTYSLEEFVETAFAMHKLDWRRHVIQSDSLLRPTDILSSFTNPSKAEDRLGWRAKSKMPDVVHRMMDGDLS